MPAMNRPTYILTIRPEVNRGAANVRALRALLKTLLRRFGYRALSIEPSDGNHHETKGEEGDET